MTSILRSVGGGFRLVGPLTLANSLINPGFENGTYGWTTTNTNVNLTPDSSRFKFGSTSCRVDVLSTASINQTYGIYQEMTDVTPGEDYTFGGWLFLPSAVGNNGPWGHAYFKDSTGAVIGTTTHRLTLGQATSDWIQVSFTETAIPDGTVSVGIDVSLVIQTVSGSTQTFYIDGTIWSAGDDNDYVDGDFASYVWSGDQYNSTTLLSTAPDALASFSDPAQSGTPHFVVY